MNVFVQATFWYAKARCLDNNKSSMHFHDKISYSIKGLIYASQRTLLRQQRQRRTKKKMESEAGQNKWRGSVCGIVDEPIQKVWNMVSQTKRLHEWMPMVERCTDLAGNEGVAGYVRLVSGFMFPQQDGERSWIKERLVSMDSSSHSYTYKMEASNLGLDGSVNSLKLVDYGDDSTLVDWSFEVNSIEGACEDSIIDYLGFLYKSCINRISGALEAASIKV